MNSTSCLVPNLLPRFAPASQPGIQTHCLTRRLGLFVAAVALLALSPLAKAQTTFVGSWIQYVPGVYGAVVEEDTQTYSGDPHQRAGYIYIGMREVPGETGFLTFTFGESWYQWRPILQEPDQIPQTDNHWNNPNVWTDGVPGGTTDARITKSGSLILPTINETAAVARSLTVFDADNTYSSFELQNGVLSLTPASVFDTALLVGVANANGGARYTKLTLVNSTLTSSGFAEIGKGQTGSGPLTGQMQIGTGSAWFHPAGLIEIGGEGGQGELLIDSGGLVAGSLLPGTATDPRIAVNSWGNFYIASGGTARLTELSVNSIAGPHYLLFGMGAAGSLETTRLIVGETAPGEVVLLSGSDSRLGAVTISRESELFLQGNPTAVADSIVVDDGKLRVGDGYSIGAQLTVGDSTSEQGAASIFKLAPASEDLANLSVFKSNSVTVHGRALLGGYGEATVTLESGGQLDIRGVATLGQSEDWSGGASGSGTVTVTGPDSVLRVQNLEVGYGYAEYRWQPGDPLPGGNLNVGGGGKVEIAGRIESYTNYNYYTQSLETITYNYPGALKIGKGGTLDILANGVHGAGRVVFTDPSNGGILNGQGQLTNTGTIKGGGTVYNPTGANIDFGPQGGELVNGGTIAPGSSAPGRLPISRLTINGDLTFQDSFSMSNGRLLIDLGGTTAGLNCDVLDVWGDVNLTGATVEFSLIDGYGPQQGATFHFLQVTGLLTGMFGTLIDHTGLGLTLDDLSLAPGGGVMLTMPVSAIPEPGTYAASLAAVALLVAAWHRRKRPRAVARN